MTSARGTGSGCGCGSQPGFAGSVDAPAPAFVPWPTGEGVRGPMLELIGYDRQYARVAAYLLGDVIVVENLRKALELWRETATDKTIVTLEGIPESERAQVMERFQRGSNTAQTPGSGLGLAIVREIAVTHGAEVRLEAGHDGKGTRASVVLPSPG